MTPTPLAETDRVFLDSCLSTLLRAVVAYRPDAIDPADPDRRAWLARELHARRERLAALAPPARSPA